MKTEDPFSIQRKVLRVDRSPLNKLRWCLELECGHEEWITSKSRPARTTMKCSACSRRVEAPG